MNPQNPLSALWPVRLWTCRRDVRKASSFVRSWGTFRTLSVALMMFVHPTKAAVLGTSSERRDCQRNISASPATTWKLGSLTVWEGKAAATAATATPAARIACYEPPGQKNRLWLKQKRQTGTNLIP